MLGDWFRLGWEIVTFKEGVIERAAADESNTVGAVVMVLLGGVASAVGTLNPIGLVVGPVFGVLGLFIGTGILWGVARLFGGTADYIGHLRAVGLANILNLATVVPFLGPILAVPAVLWSLAVNVIIVERLHRLSRGQAIAVVLLPVFVCCLGVLVLGVAAAVMIPGLMQAMHAKGMTV
ncbi:MAG: hypothetical protein D6679_01830 [Candidatus Hydrogenedentota bacterium]|nr:MAG: hypothetical protein D6679_01830 [Candidatus Hydrogenedentota bacterium]